MPSTTSDHDSEDEPIDGEVAALALIVDALSTLESDAQTRMLTYLNDRYLEYPRNGPPVFDACRCHSRVPHSWDGAHTDQHHGRC